MQKIAATAIIHPNVTLGKNIVIEDYCVIGALPANHDGAIPATIIGDGAVIRSHTVIYAGNKIGHNFNTGNKANIRESNIIGDNVSIGTLSVIEHHVVIEDHVRIHTAVFVPEYTILKRFAWLGPNVVLTNARYPQSANCKDELQGPVVGEYAKVGANCTLLPGVEIGEHALIGAGSVVTKNVQAHWVCVGNPAQRIKQLSDLPYGATEN